MKSWTLILQQRLKRQWVATLFWAAKLLLNGFHMTKVLVCFDELGPHADNVICHLRNLPAVVVL